MNKWYWMEIAIRLAYDNAVTCHGGPFGAIVVKEDRIIGKGINEVTSTNDPTAHAEMQAIRDACRLLKCFQLTNCEIYISCAPCPMCLGAMYWARPSAVYYAATSKDASEYGFDDTFIYHELSLPESQRYLFMRRINKPDEKFPFDAWNMSTCKLKY
jgi:guanine deaminase